MNDTYWTVCSNIEDSIFRFSERKIIFPKDSDVDNIVGLIVLDCFCGEFDAIPTDSCKETEMFFESIGVEETFGDVSVDIVSISGISANPNGMLDVIKNKIVIRDKTDFN